MPTLATISREVRKRGFRAEDSESTEGFDGFVLTEACKWVRNDRGWMTGDRLSLKKRQNKFRANPSKQQVVEIVAARLK